MKALTRILFTWFLEFNFALGKPHLTGPNLAVRQEVLEKMKGLNTLYEISGDVELGLRAKNYG